MTARPPAPAFAVVASRITYEERRILDAARCAGVDAVSLDPRRYVFRLADRDLCAYPPAEPFDPRNQLCLMREVSQSRSAYLARTLESMGATCVNASGTIARAGDKLLSSLLLQEGGVPIPSTSVAFDEDCGVAEARWLGFPAVVKPTVGSWGRLVAKVNDAEAARTVIEHRFQLPNPLHKTLYLQRFVGSEGRDLRVIVLGGQALGAIERFGSDWRANVARDAGVRAVDLPDGVLSLAERAAKVLGGDVVAVDLLRDLDGTYLVNEVNHNVEFKGFEQATGIDVAGAIVAFLAERDR